MGRVWKCFGDDWRSWICCERFGHFQLADLEKPFDWGATVNRLHPAKLAFLKSCGKGEAQLFQRFADVAQLNFVVGDQTNFVAFSIGRIAQPFGIGRAQTTVARVKLRQLRLGRCGFHGAKYVTPIMDGQIFPIRIFYCATTNVRASSVCARSTRTSTRCPKRLSTFNKRSTEIPSNRAREILDKSGCFNPTNLAVCRYAPPRSRMAHTI